MLLHLNINLKWEVKYILGQKGSADKKSLGIPGIDSSMVLISFCGVLKLKFGELSPENSTATKCLTNKGSKGHRLTSWVK